MVRKYRNERAMVDGIIFASQAEARRYSELKLMEKARVIRDLKLQPKYKLFGMTGRELRYDSKRVIYYIADFEYVNEFGNKVIEDVKGYDTPASKLKRAIMRGMGRPVEVVK